jgi:hypothetical protein
MCYVNQCLTLIIEIFPVRIINCLSGGNEYVDTVHTKSPHIPMSESGHEMRWNHASAQRELFPKVVVA